MDSPPAYEGQVAPLLTLPFELRHKILSELFASYAFRLRLDDPALAKRQMTWYRCLECRLSPRSSSALAREDQRYPVPAKHAQLQLGGLPAHGRALLETCSLLRYEASLMIANNLECLLKGEADVGFTPQMVWESIQDWRSYVPAVVRTQATDLRIEDPIQLRSDPLKLGRMTKIEQFLPNLSSLRSIAWFSGDVFVHGMIWRGSPPHLMGRIAIKMASKEGKKPEGPWGYVGVEHGALSKLLAQLEHHVMAKMLQRHSAERGLSLTIQVALTWAFGPRLTPPTKPGYALSIDMATKQSHLFYLNNEWLPPPRLSNPPDSHHKPD